MKELLLSLSYKNKESPLVCYPSFFRLSNVQDKNNLNQLLSSAISIEVFDEILEQVEEYVKSINPKHVFTKTELTEAAKRHIGNVPYEEYGVWVYYPWLQKLVHLLDENEFVQVRTNRNQYKITPAEKEILQNKKIGIIGLSVGQSIALTMAMERICGELRIADFDVLELSNLNRIRAGVQNLGIPKTIVVAREIAEIDPFIQVTFFSDGLTEENVDDFFLKGGKLDVCVEVCDGLFAKIFARQKAKSFEIPVVMNSSDKGTTDIERFDIDPQRPLLHGLIDHLDLGLIKEAKTNEEKVPYLLPMLGVDTSSERLKASMLEIQESITTWPQLASGVVFGGGICTDVCRRILLNQLHNSGRYFVDVENLISDETSDYIEESHKNQKTILKIQESSIEDYRKTLNEIEQKNICSDQKLISKDLTSTEIETLIGSAMMAPSGGNIQPWKWLYKDKTLLLFQDVYRTVSVLNYKNSASQISFGAACENLILKAHAMGYHVLLSKFPLGMNSDLIAAINFTDKVSTHSEKQDSDKLVHFIEKRSTNRTLGKRMPLKDEDEAKLLHTLHNIQGASVKLFKTEDELGKLKHIVSEVERLFFTCKEGNKQFSSELRWTKEEVEKTKDGIDINTLDVTPTELAGLMVSKSWNVTKYMREWKKGSGFSKLAKKAINASSAVGLITMPKGRADAYFEGGRALQKIWLTCSSKAISLQPLSILTFLFARIEDDNFEGIEEIKDDLILLFNTFRKITKMKDDEKEMFLFRLSYSLEAKPRSLRRDIRDIMLYE